MLINTTVFLETCAVYPLIRCAFLGNLLYCYDRAVMILGVYKLMMLRLPVCSFLLCISFRFVNIGTVLACFHSCGTVPSRTDNKLNIIVSGTLINCRPAKVAHKSTNLPFPAYTFPLASCWWISVYSCCTPPPPSPHHRKNPWNHDLTNSSCLQFPEQLSELTHDRCRSVLIGVVRPHVQTNRPPGSRTHYLTDPLPDVIYPGTRETHRHRLLLPHDSSAHTWPVFARFLEQPGSFYFCNLRTILITFAA